METAPPRAAEPASPSASEEEYAMTEPSSSSDDEEPAKTARQKATTAAAAAAATTPQQPDDSSSEDGAARCRICYERDGGGAMALIRPCACKGSMELIHKQCLLRWLASSPALVTRGCAVCETPWREEFVRTPSVKRFVVDMVRTPRGAAALRRFFRHVSDVPRFNDEDDFHPTDVRRRGRRRPRRRDDEENDDAFFVEGDDDQDFDDDDDDDDDLGAGDEDDDDEIGGLGGALGLLAPAGGGVEELNAACAAIVRLALWSLGFALAVCEGRAALRLFAWGVRAVLVLDSRVDALLLPGSVAAYLENFFPAMPCLREPLRRAARFVHQHRRTPDAGTTQRRSLRRVVLFFLRGGGDRAAKDIQKQRPWWHVLRLIPSLVPAGARRSSSFRGATAPAPAETTTATAVLKTGLARAAAAVGAVGPWRVDDVFVGFVALALNVRCLARFARRRHRGFSLRPPPNNASVGRHLAAAVARVALSPEAVAHDVATLFEHLVSSPLLVIHWLCVFPSYVYALRLVLARLRLLAADARVLDLENGDGLAFHLSLLAVAASATTCFAALVHALHREFTLWTADVALANLRT